VKQPRKPGKGRMAERSNAAVLKSTVVRVLFCPFNVLVLSLIAAFGIGCATGIGLYHKLDSRAAREARAKKK